MVPAVAIQGTLSGFGTDTLTDSSVDFDSALTTGESYFVEVLSGDFTGTSLNVSDWFGDTITVDGVSDLNSILVGGESYRIREHWTIGKVFGANNEVGLQAGSSNNADLIFISDGQGGFRRIFRSSGFPAGTGWRAVGQGTSDFSDEVIWFSDAVLIDRRNSDPLDLTLLGTLKTGVTIVPVEEGFNFLSSVYPTDGSTLGNSGLFDDSTPNFGLSSGTSNNADLVLYESQIGNGDFQRFFYSTGFPAGVGWRKVGAGTTPQDDSVIPSAIVVQRGAGQGAVNVKLQPPF